MQLDTWLEKRKMAAKDFAAAVGVTVQTVYRWRSGDRIPDAPSMTRIAVVTRGKVLPSDFFPEVRSALEHAKAELAAARGE